MADWARLQLGRAWGVCLRAFFQRSNRFVSLTPTSELTLRMVEPMSLSVEQLVYTSFPDLGNRVLTSKNLPQAIQQSFMQAVVHPYWQRQSLMEPALAGQSPGGRIIRAAYLHQLLPEQTLFGWLYSDPSVQDSEDCTTHFVCYYLTQKLDGLLLDGIFNCLETGPEIQLEGLEGSEGLESVTLPTSGEYTATRLGVSIPSSVRARSRLLLYKEKLLQFSVPVEVPIEVPQKTQSAGDRPALPQQLPLQSWTELPASPSLPKPDFVQPTQKVALLIGISKSELGFQALPGVEKDIEALEEILVAPNIGAFTTVKTLLNPDSQEMAEEIESFLSTCPADSLALLYFSGHGIWDSQGTLCLTTSASRRGPQQKIVRSTFLSADFLGAVLQDSTVRYPVLMLDCCLSEDSPPNESARKRRLEQVRQQFTESGATVLASSTAIHHTGVQKGHRLSAYTSYLVEGLATGIADLDEDGTISLDEWHTYAMRKAQLASPALRPALYRLPGQPQLAIAKLAEHDPRLQYRREVERCIKNGSISLVNQLILDKSQRNLQLAAADCIKIKAEMLKPHQEYQQKLRQYATVFLNQVQQEGAGYRPVSSQILRLKDTLGLTDADTAPIQAEILQQLTVVQLPLSKVLAPTSGTMPLWNTNRVQSLLRTRPALQTVLAQAAILPLALAGLIAPAERWVGQVSQTIGHTLSRRRPDLLRAVLNLKALNLSALNQWRKSKSTSSIFAGLTPVTVLLGISVVVLLLTAILFDAQQQQRRKRALTQLDTLFQQRDYEKCVADAQQLPRRLGPSPQIQQLLEQCQAGLSWKNTTVSTLPPPSGTIQSMVFGQSGSLLASGGEDPNIQIWDVSAKTLLRTLEGHRDEIRILAASQDGAMLASGSTDKTVRIWQFSTGKLLHTLEGHQGTVQSLSFVPKGQLLASGAEDGTIRLWNTASGKLVRSLKGDKSDKIAIRAIAVSADGKILVSSGAQKAITFWNMEDGKPIRTLKGHTDRIAALVSNGEQFASGSLDKTVKLWRFSDGALLRTISGQDAEPVKSLAFSPSNPILASTSEASVELREADTGKLFHRFSGSSSEVSAMAYSPDGQTLAIARRNKLLNLLRR
jgi:WD40 repeat protein